MVYLIGVDHVRAQRKKRGVDLTDCQRMFQSVLESTIQSTDPLTKIDSADLSHGRLNSTRTNLEEMFLGVCTRMTIDQ